MANTYFSTDQLGIKFTAVETTQEGFQLGTKKKDQLGNTWCYVQANGAVDIYDAVKIDDDYQIAVLNTTLSGAEPTKVGVAQNAFADNEYGWVMVEGKGTINALTSCAADVKLYTTATDGHVDDEASSSDLIAGLKLLTAIGGGGAGTAEFFASMPMVTNAS